jgi:hypothetical protein
VSSRFKKLIQQRVTKVDLNMKAAKALGLTVPLTGQVAAELIE